VRAYSLLSKSSWITVRTEEFESRPIKSIEQSKLRSGSTRTGHCSDHAGLVPLPRIRCRRPSGARRDFGLLAAVLEAFDEIRFEIDDPVEVEDGVLIVENLAYLRGRDGIEVQARSAWLITIRDGKTTSLTLYQTKQEALEAAGLRE
jgi:hypothetical protein